MPVLGILRRGIARFFAPFFLRRLRCNVHRRTLASLSERLGQLGRIAPRPPNSERGNPRLGWGPTQLCASNETNPTRPTNICTSCGPGAETVAPSTTGGHNGPYGSLSPEMNLRSTPLSSITARRITPPDEPSRAIAWLSALLTKASHCSLVIPGL